jgi:hypothetical protein
MATKEAPELKETICTGLSPSRCRGIKNCGHNYEALPGELTDLKRSKVSETLNVQLGGLENPLCSLVHSRQLESP